MVLKRLLTQLSVYALLIVMILGGHWLTQADAQTDEPTVELYQLFEFTVDFEDTSTNPYDPADISVVATFTPPTGRAIEVPAFFMQPYEQTCTDDCSAEVLEAQGEGEWRVRFTPTQAGRWRYAVNVTLADATPRAVQQGSFMVTEAEGSGFVRVGENGRYFVFDDGTPYFPVGQNLGWSWAEGGGIFTYLAWLNKLEAAGANYARIYIDVPWFIGLEWTAPPGQYGNSGQEAAWRMDTIVQAAEERGIYLQVVLVWYQGFVRNQGSPVLIPTEPARAPVREFDFEDNPYNSRFAGSLSDPSAIFRDPVSLTRLQNRFRYIVARWGYSTHIMAWEVVDSIDQMAGFGVEGGLVWLNALTATLRDNDPNDHLITFGMGAYNTAMVQGAEVDFIQTRFYQNRPIETTGDQTALTLQNISLARATTPKPILLSEFSLNRWYEPTADDESGVHIQNTLWSSVLSGAAGGAMPWWWDTYLDPQNLYDVYTPLRLFTHDIAWHELDFQLIEPGLVADTELEYTPLRIEDFNRQFRSPSLPDTVYHVTADGTAPPVSLTTSYLYGRQFNAENSRPQTFIISPPIDTVFTVRIENVSTAADAQLQVSIDGVVVNTIDLTAGTRGISFSFPLSAGQHTVVLDNLGQDWLQLAYLEIEDYIAPLRALALADVDAGVALVWIHHRDYTWDTVQAGEGISPLQFRLDLPQMPAGVYRIEFWNPLTGDVIGEEQFTATDTSPLSIDLLPIDTQLAIRVFRIGGDEAPTSAPPDPTRTPAVTPSD